MPFILPRKNKNTVSFDKNGLLARRDYAWTPYLIDTIGWWDPSDTDTITDSGGAVSQVDDKSGNGIHLTQTRGSAQPTTGTRNMNGLNILDCDGGDWMEKTSFPVPASGDISFFLVAEIDSVDDTNDSVYSLKNTSQSNFQFDSNSASQWNGQIKTNNNGNTSLSGGPFAGPSIYSLVFDFATNSDIYAYIDGVLRATDSTYVSKLQDSPAPILQVFSNRSQLDYPDGAFGELIICEDVTEETRQKIEGYLAWKWDNWL